jgi:tRNA threonylcarbamoyladenosine modification (KEOPS) complex  Pcc1 subunit
MTTTRIRVRSAVLVALLLVATLLVTAVASQIASAKSAEVIHRAVLKGSATYPAVNGTAKWKAKDGQRELEVQIEDAMKLKGKRLAVRIDGRVVGYMRVNSLGRARLVRRTEAGQSVPKTILGKPVRVRTAGGVLVASGRF